MSRTLRTRLRPAAVAAAALLAAAGPAAAQSVLSASGLGYPLPPIDARARGLGGVSVGLGGPGLSLVNPAAPAGLPAPAISLTFQPDFYAAEAERVDTDGSTSRFPALQVAFPLRRLVAYLGYGSFLDQNWQVVQRDSVELAGERREVVNRFASDGAVARFRLGAAFQAGPRLGLGVAADLFTGSVQDTIGRAVQGLSPFVQATRTRYPGVGGAAGVRWAPSDAVSLGAAVSGGGDLTAELTRDSLELSRTYAIPLAVDLGASARVSQNTVVALAGRWAGWSATEADLSASGGARDALSLSGGLEYEGFAFAGRTMPLRVGARYAELPFRWVDSEGAHDFPAELAATAGLGARLAGGAARVDLAGERGRRGGDAAGFREDFWRLSVTLTLLAR